MINGADTAPTTQGEAAVADTLKALANTVGVFNTLKNEQLPAFNKQLQSANLPALNLRAEIIDSVLDPYDEGEEP